MRYQVNTRGAVYIPEYKGIIQKRTTDHLSASSSKMMVILLTLQWVEAAPTQILSQRKQNVKCTKCDEIKDEIKMTLCCL